MDASRAADERAACGRRSRVVLTPRRWRQVGGATRRRRWQTSPVTGESSKETVNTIAQGNAGLPGGPVVTTLVCYLHTAHEAAGAAGTRLSLRPLRGPTFLHSFGRVAPREGGCLSAPQFEDRTGKLARTWCLRWSRPRSPEPCFKNGHLLRPIAALLNNFTHMPKIGPSRALTHAGL